MTETQVTEVMEHYQPYLPQLSALTLYSKLRSASPTRMDELMRVRMKSQTTSILLAIFLGSIGVARFYLHDIFIAVWRIILTAFVNLSIYIELTFYATESGSSWWDNSWFGLSIVFGIASFVWYIADIFMMAVRTKRFNLDRLIHFLSADKYKNYNQENTK